MKAFEKEIKVWQEHNLQTMVDLFGPKNLKPPYGIHVPADFVNLIAMARKAMYVPYVHPLLNKLREASEPFRFDPIELAKSGLMSWTCEYLEFASYEEEPNLTFGQILEMHKNYLDHSAQVKLAFDNQWSILKLVSDERDFIRYVNSLKSAQDYENNQVFGMLFFFSHLTRIALLFSGEEFLEAVRDFYFPSVQRVQDELLTLGGKLLGMYDEEGDDAEQREASRREADRRVEAFKYMTGQGGGLIAEPTESKSGVGPLVGPLVGV